MKVYRGPSSKGFLDELTERVASVDLSKDTGPWTEEKRVTVNISKTQATERKADAYIQFEPEDILALYNGLIAGLIRENTKAKGLHEALAEIWRCVAFAKNDVNTLKKIKSVASDAIKNYRASAP